MRYDWRRNPDAEAKRMAKKAYTLRQRGLSLVAIADKLGVGQEKAGALVYFGQRWYEDDGECPYCGRPL